MTPLRLTSWFKKRMLPLVVASSGIVAAAAPIAFYVQKRSELLSQARGEAARVAEVVRTAIEERPRLYRYDAIKLGERLAAEGLDRRPLHVRAGGAEVPIERMHGVTSPRAPLWGRYDIQIDPDLVATETPGTASDLVASVWVAADAWPLYTGTALLALLFTLLAAALGTFLFLWPARAIGRAERRVHLLLGRLALTLQEEDRRRIARDLHDGAGQAITAARLELLALAAQQAAPATEPLRRIGKNLDEALAEVRRSTAALAPPALAELGFARAIRRLCETFADTASLQASCEIAGDLPALGGEIELHVYRIVQEALTNVARHAQARTVVAQVELVRAPGRARALRVTVEDDGAGVADGAAASGRGIEGMRERATLLGGELRLVPGAGGRGVRVEATVPIELETAA